MTIADIKAQVAAKHGVRIAELEGPGRWRSLAYARFEAFYLARQVVRQDGKPRWSYPTIGRYFGGRDHATVIHGVRRHQKMMAADQ